MLTSSNNTLTCALEMPQTPQARAKGTAVDHWSVSREGGGSFTVLQALVEAVVSSSTLCIRGLTSTWTGFTKGLEVRTWCNPFFVVN